MILAAVMAALLLTGCALMSDTSAPFATPSTTGAPTSVATTPAQTTLLPTTVTPTTVPPTTVPPTTVPPTTVPPTTVPPTTVPPTTVPPTTVPPTTVPPTTAPTVPPMPFPELSGTNAFVYDTRSASFLYISCGKYDALYPASITKLFTTYVALQYLAPDQQITVGAERDLVVWDASVAGLNRGDTLTALDLAKCALLVSGCEASYTLAVAAGREILHDPGASEKTAVDIFMVQVNQSAALLGMINTRFVTPDGNHADDHKISMDAYVIIAKTCLQDDTMAAMMSAYTDTVRVTNASGRTRTITLRNTNEHVNPNNPRFYVPEAVGLKTGYTSKAGACLLSAFRVDGGYLIIGVFGCPNYDARYADAIALLQYYQN